MDESELAQRLDYSFFHIIPLTPTLKTPGVERYLAGGPPLAGHARAERWRVLGACVILSALGAVVLCDLLWPPVVPFQQY